VRYGSRVRACGSLMYPKSLRSNANSMGASLDLSPIPTKPANPSSLVCNQHLIVKIAGISAVTHLSKHASLSSGHTPHKHVVPHAYIYAPSTPLYASAHMQLCLSWPRSPTSGFPTPKRAYAGRLAGPIGSPRANRIRSCRSLLSPQAIVHFGGPRSLNGGSCTVPRFAPAS
jgi:hypothetical protein